MSLSASLKPSVMFPIYCDEDDCPSDHWKVKCSLNILIYLGFFPPTSWTLDMKVYLHDSNHILRKLFQQSIAFFWRIRGLFVWYLGFVTKNLIDNVSNLQIINIGQIGRLIQNWKFVIFLIFAHFSHFFSKNFSKLKFQYFAIISETPQAIPKLF